ncbi:MAG: 16S rRNA (cytidine(1402)-2'-O)-methyltransferase [bacterium]|nr:16S rRNA (cytidine(1402)-2'-O)-methyltransferase [bacterium]MDE0290171.1 16S rRNA (cytidine(1402)-2'-O)-methyltransferase [bacterium]MDE0440012.1 16S rRNA (cytidine(1402)-2'-O)-methyltransferase [bacterium]
MTGRLVLCGTPIGHLGDASPRLAEVLGQAEVVFAEDTRRARVLLDHLGVTTVPRSYFAGNEASRRARLALLLEQGATVALLADAGMPTVCDPGFSAVREARRVGAAVSVVPGPSAVVAALAVSGLPSERFAFEGFLPRKGGQRARRLEELAAESRTIVLFSPTARVRADLSSLAAVLGGGRHMTVARELTKAHEEVWSGTLEEAVAEWQRRSPRGEFTLVIAGWPGSTTPMGHAVAEVEARKADGEPMSQAVRTVADALGLGRRSLYEAVLKELRS